MTEVKSTGTAKAKYIFLGFTLSMASIFLFFAIITVCFIVGITTLIGNASSNISNMETESSTLVSKRVISDGTASETIGVIDIRGVISVDKDFENVCSGSICTLLKRLSDDKDVKAIILRVNSPGGEVTASDIIHDAIVQTKQKKPIIVYMESMAASGGYYISAPANWIVAAPTTITGSIGVIISGVNVKDTLGYLGIKEQVFTSGEFKDMLSMTREMTSQEATYVQYMVNQSYDRFLRIVTEGRKKTKEQLASANAIDGRILSGADALKAGLVDELGYMQQAINKAASMSRLRSPRVMEYSIEPSLADILGSVGLTAKAEKSVHLNLQNTQRIKVKPGMPYLLPSSYASGL